MGYLAATHAADEDAMRRAMIYGSVMASFNVEEFSCERTRRLTYDEIDARFKEFRSMTDFEVIQTPRRSFSTT